MQMRIVSKANKRVVANSSHRFDFNAFFSIQTIPDGNVWQGYSKPCGGKSISFEFIELLATNRDYLS